VKLSFIVMVVLLTIVIVNDTTSSCIGVLLVRMILKVIQGRELQANISLCVRIFVH